jgi:DNA-binding NarL/FixJ family response regulator
MQESCAHRGHQYFRTSTKAHLEPAKAYVPMQATGPLCNRACLFLQPRQPNAGAIFVSAQRSAACRRPSGEPASISNNLVVAVLGTQERRIAGLACRGLSNKRIARQIGIIEGVVKLHICIAFIGNSASEGGLA